MLHLTRLTIVSRWVGNSDNDFRFSQAGAVAASPDSRPNVILIVADDQASVDLGCYCAGISSRRRWTRARRAGRAFRAILLGGAGVLSLAGGHVDRALSHARRHAGQCRLTARRQHRDARRTSCMSATACLFGAA